MMNKYVNFESIDTECIYFIGFSDGIKPVPDFTISEWADAHRVLTSRSSAEAGKWETKRTPYLKLIMDMMSPNAKNLKGEPASYVVFMKGAQIGGSECLINAVGFYIDYAPCPILYVLPTVDLAKLTSTDRIDPLIEETPSVNKKIGKKRTHNAENAILKKGFAGGSLRFIGANSPVGLRSAAVRALFMDEVSSYPKATEEGDPVELAVKRAQTFGDSKKIFAVSTPTIEGECKITSLYEKSDKRKYHLPCPHCNFFQELVFEQFKWEKGKPDTVFYECKNCNKKMEERHKTEMLANGKWVAEHPERSIVGFHLSSLYSPVGWKSWKEVIEEYEDAKGNPEKERVFTNTVLGLPYRLKGDSVSWENLFNTRRENYQRNTIPKEVLLLTCGCDVQADRIECEIVGWGRDKKSWSIDYRVLFGDTSKEEVWKELAELISEEFKSESTGELRKIQMTCVDSGYNTVNVYNFTRKYSPSHVMAIKGQENLPAIYSNPKNIDFSFKGKKITNGVRLTMLGVSVLKQELFGFLRNERNEDGSFPYGYCHFPQEYSQEYFQMLTAEEYICSVNEKNQKKYEWIKVRERNEALDCRNYARAAASLLGYDRLKDSDFDALEEQYGFYDPELEKNIQAQEEAKLKVTEQDDYWKNRDNNSEYWKNR